MPSFTMTHEIDCDLERFWKIFFDKDVTKATYVHLGFPKWELVEERDTDKEIIRRVKAVPKLDLPGPVKKVFGDGFGYTEDGRFDKEKKEYKFVITPTTMADKLKNEGKVRAEAINDGKRPNGFVGRRGRKHPTQTRRSSVQFLNHLRQAYESENREP